ncbi:MAG: hypothetical protein EXR79_02410 [Myxococcales bacterium]|nr:hypothetical protein [Myxococcales bacterium]
MVATAPTGEALVHVAVLPAGGGASDVLWASDGPGKVEACWYAKFANLCQTTCFTSQAACGNVYSLSSCVQGTRHTPATHIQWQRIDALLQPQGGPVSVLQASVGCTIGAPAPALSAVVAVALEDGKRFVAWTTPQGTHKVLLQAGGAIIKSLGVEPKQKNPAVAAFSDGRVLLAWDDGEDVWAQMYASSGDKDGTPFPVNAQAAGKQWGPVVAALPNGRSVVAWNTDAGEGDVRAQMFKQEPGLPLGAEFQVNTSAPGPQGKPAIAVHADGTFAIAFEDGANGDGSGWGIAAHWFSPTGVKVGGPKVIDTTTTGDQRLPAAVGAGDAAVFVWTNLNGGHVYLRRHDKTGATLPGTPEVVVNQQKQGDQSAPALATWSGGLAVAWESDGQDGDGAAIVWRRFNESAVAAGPETLVNTTKAGPQLHVALGADKEGNVVAVWDSFNQDGDLEAVVLQRFGKDGQKLGGEVVVNQQTLNEQQRPAVAVLPNGKTVVAWESFAQKGGQSYDVVARCYDEQGVAFGAEAIVNEQAGDKQLAPQLAPFSDDSGKVLLVWQSYGEDGSEWGVYGQLLYQTCAKVGPPFAVNSFKTGEQSQPRAAVAADGSFTVAWRSADQDGSGFGVFAQAFDKNAQKVGAEFKWNLVTADEQSRPAIAATGGLWLAAWQTIGEDEAGMAIKASVRTGKAQQGADFMANLTFTGNQSLPAVAALPSGAVAIAWASQGQDGDKGAAVVRVLKP